VLGNPEADGSNPSPATQKPPINLIDGFFVRHRKAEYAIRWSGVSAAPAFDRAGTAPEGQAFFLLMEAAWKETT